MALAELLDQPLWPQVELSLGAAGWGGFAAVPLVLLFLWSLTVAWGPVVALRTLLERWILPAFRPLRWWQLGLIALAAGVGEEALFRGVIQRALERTADPTAALVGASVLFGLAHMITLGYAVFAAVFGCYLGLLLLWGDNLLVPMLCHAVYDFAVLTYLLKVRRPIDPAAPP